LCATLIYFSYFLPCFLHFSFLYSPVSIISFRLFSSFLPILLHFINIFCPFLYSLYRYVFPVHFLPCSFILFLLSQTSSFFQICFRTIENLFEEGHDEISGLRKRIILGGRTFSLVLLSSLL
jgi:hypothetical protein